MVTLSGRQHRHPPSGQCKSLQPDGSASLCSAYCRTAHCCSLLLHNSASLSALRQPRLVLLLLTARQQYEPLLCSLPDSSLLQLTATQQRKPQCAAPAQAGAAAAHCYSLLPDSSTSLCSAHSQTAHCCSLLPDSSASLCVLRRPRLVLLHSGRGLQLAADFLVPSRGQVNRAAGNQICMSHTFCSFSTQCGECTACVRCLLRNPSHETHPCCSAYTHPCVKGRIPCVAQSTQQTPRALNLKGLGHRDMAWA